MLREWKVGELAKLAGLTVRTLRFYDQIGLFSPSGHSVSGYRLYTETDISRLQQILSLKELGLSLEQIKAVMAGDQLSLLDIVSLQMDRLKENIRIQQKLLNELENVSNRMQRNEPLTVENFTKIMRTMRMNHEKYFAERKSSWDLHLDRLSEYLDEHPGNPAKEDSTMNEPSAKHSTFVIERSYKHSPARVFAVWAGQAAKAGWFPKAEEFDFRVGGREFNRGGPPEGPIYTFDALYQEIVPDRRIVYSYTLDMEDTRISVSVTTVEFKPDDSGTRLIYTEQGVFLDGHDTPEQREHGTKALLDQLGNALNKQ
jgi:MerR family transcriptional regulator, thiopeptide resistance regulator